MPHVLYTREYFTNEEIQKINPLALIVCEWGLSVCKLCGAAECELENPCTSEGLPPIPVMPLSKAVPILGKFGVHYDAGRLTEVAGLIGAKRFSDVPHCFHLQIDGVWKVFDPLNDPADSQYLMVKLKINVKFDETGVTASHGDIEWRVEIASNDLGGHYALRRAILRVAADMGEEKYQ